ncbi:MAG TPA: TIGR02281 family clan AA aspartic protease [Arenicellales bacterium]|nr:TIGR02281 family clan AA aspartic protease [Arenicellales bacterium]
MQKTRALRALLVAVLLGSGWSAGGAARAAAIEKLTVLALFEGKALLHVDGSRRLIAEGETSPEGIKLLQADSSRAVVEIDGRQEVLEVGMMTGFPGAASDVAPAWDGPEKLTLWAEDDGFFYASGSINGSSVRFLVDTGANSIAINRHLAERLGIDYREGRQGMATTASGVTPMYLVTLDRVSVGEITLRNVEAGVLLGSHPDVPLLGMSFLGKLDMNRTGNRLDLIRR